MQITRTNDVRHRLEASYCTVADITAFCPDLGCARRVYATGAACHPAEGKDLAT